MTTGNGVPTVTHDGEDLYARDGGRHLRDIEELVAKLRLVTRQLAVSARPTPAPGHATEYLEHTGYAERTDCPEHEDLASVRLGAQGRQGNLTENRTGQIGAVHHE